MSISRSLIINLRSILTIKILFYLLRMRFFKYLVGAGSIMNHGLVLLSGIGFIIFSGLVFFLLRIVERSPLKSKTKRIAHFCAFALLTLVCILIFDWYSSDYIKSAIVR